MFFSVTCVRGDKKTEIYSQHLYLEFWKSIQESSRRDLNLSSHTKQLFQISAVGCKTFFRDKQSELLKGGTVHPSDECSVKE